VRDVRFPRKSGENCLRPWRLCQGGAAPPTNWAANYPASFAIAIPCPADPFLVEMDPLSVTAGVLAIITATEQTRRALDRVRSALKAMPGRLSALNNQVADLEVLLHQIVSLMASHDEHPELARPEAHN